MNTRREAYEILYNELMEHDMLNALQKYRYGSDTDAILKNNLSIMCPDIKYELSKDIDIKVLTVWLKKYVDYGMEYFSEYKSRIERESGEILTYLENKRRKELFNLDGVKKLPYELRLKIIGYLPMKERGLGAIGDKWCEMSLELKKMKGEELNKLLNRIKMSTNGALPGWQSVDYEKMNELRNIRSESTINMNKEEKIAWIKSYILSNLNIDSRDEALRQKIIKDGFTTIIKLVIIIKCNTKKRLKIENERKERKKEKRRLRIRKNKGK